VLPIISRKNIHIDRRRGGEVQTLLSPKTVGSTSGFMGVAHVGPGEKVAEHYHPYSEEFLYLVDGTLEVQVDGEAHTLHAGDGVTLPIGSRHRLVNRSGAPAFAVFHLGPLAPRPELGHVDTEGDQLNDHLPARRPRTGPEDGSHPQAGTVTAIGARPKPGPEAGHAPEPAPDADVDGQLARFQASMMPWELGLWSLGWIGGAPSVWPPLHRSPRPTGSWRLFGRRQAAGKRGGRR
jgi:putative monooxygenase